MGHETYGGDTSRPDDFGSQFEDFPFHGLIAGGGTGGHLFPGIALCQELERRFERSHILFVVGRRRRESEILSRYGYKSLSINVEGIKGRGWKKGLTVLAKIPKSFRQSVYIIKAFSPDVVVGMGGYSAGPVCLAARFMGIPTAIHEQNAFPGLTNRLLCRFVDCVFISFEESIGYLRGRSILLVGNPIRRDLFSAIGSRREEGDKFTVLVIGGSLGARPINEMFLEALTYLNRKGIGLEVIHQTGESDYARVQAEYRNRGLEGDVQPFIQDMSTAYNHADLVVSRAGASTIFELAALGKPCILIPYPHAANQHQETNALSLVRLGGAEMIRQSELTGEALARVLMKYMDDRHALAQMGANAKRMVRRNAAKEMADQLIKMTRPR